MVETCFMGTRDFCRQKSRLALRQCPIALAMTLEALGPFSEPNGGGSSRVMVRMDSLSKVTVNVKSLICSKTVVNSVSNSFQPSRTLVKGVLKLR